MNEDVLSKEEKVNHPLHYNKPGRKECIEEMIEKYGLIEVIIFCKLNAYQYLYRYEDKNGVEDVKKAAWYLIKMMELWQKITD